MNPDGPLREQVLKLLDWEDAHVGFDAVVEFGPAPVTGPTRGELAARVQRAITDRFVPLVQKERLGS